MNTRKAKTARRSRVREPIPSPEQIHATLISAVRDKLRAAIEAPLTPSSLMLLERTIKLARQMLVLGKYSGPMNAADSTAAIDMAQYDLSQDKSDDVPPVTITSPIGPVALEQFGATAIRNLIGGINANKKPSPELALEDLLRLLSLARDEGIEDVASDLLAEIRARLKNKGNVVALLEAARHSAETAAAPGKAKGRSGRKQGKAS